MRARAFVLALVVATAAVGPAGCGQPEPPAAQQTARSYQGKPDTVPWDSPEWGGNQATWERAIEARTRYQSEYTRER